MVRRCILCEDEIEEQHGKLKGTIIKAKNLDNKNDLYFVCSSSQKEDKWIEKAKVKGV